MSLTVEDLLKIQEILQPEFDKLATKETLTEEVTSVKSKVAKVQDDIMEVQRLLETEHELRWKRVEKNSVDIIDLKQRLSLI